MKTNIFYYIVILTLAALTYSCTDMRDVFDEYVGDEEVVYSTKLKNAVIFPGVNRVQIAGELSDPFNVSKVVVYWDERSANKTFDYMPIEGTDSVSYFIEGLEEKAYIFEVITEGNGYFSVPVQLSAVAYGDIFRSNLEPRKVSSFLYDGANINLTFAQNAEFARNTQIVYYDMNNNPIEVIVSGETREVKLSNAIIDSSFTIQTSFMPELTSIDEIKTDIKKFKIPEIGSILNTIQLSQFPTGCVVSWKNPKKQSIKIIVDYNYDLNRKVVTSNEAVGVMYVSGMNVDDIKVTVSDLYNNAFGPVDVAFTSTMEEVKLVKTGWEVIDFSSQETAPSQLASNIIDDNLATRWHTQYNGARPNYPHHVTVDMKKEVSISRIELFKRQDVNVTGFTKFEFLVSNDAVNFTSLGIFDFNRLSMAGQSFDAAGKGRYFKFLAIAGASDVTNLAEINVFGAE